MPQCKKVPDSNSGHTKGLAVCHLHVFPICAWVFSPALKLPPTVPKTCMLSSSRDSKLLLGVSMRMNGDGVSWGRILNSKLFLILCYQCSNVNGWSSKVAATSVWMGVNVYKCFEWSERLEKLYTRTSPFRYNSSICFISLYVPRLFQLHMCFWEQRVQTLNTLLIHSGE